MPNRPLSVLALATIAQAALGGCRNACQDICVRMANFAEECGFTVADAELDACIEDQAEAEDLAVCRDYGSPQAIREEWTCADMGEYWNAPPET
jgi:hypothetical protein